MNELYTNLIHSLDRTLLYTIQLYPKVKVEEIGTVISVNTSVVNVRGLPGIQSEEMVLFEDGTQGMVFNLDEEEIAIILFDKKEIRTGDEVERQNRIVDVPVGESLLGRVVDGLGRPLDNKGPINAVSRLPIERPAKSIMERSPVKVPLQTGIIAIDALIPVGRGQRELILGDRQTGKTAIAIDTIINQKNTGVICIYCSIGRELSAVAKIVSDLQRQDALQYSIIVAASGEDTPGLNYITPYAATSMGEYFMEKGMDALIIYDDLTRHAWAYRELSLLMRRPPAREAYPGDIFYIHSRLLERATHLKSNGGSLTAFPIIETEEQNLSAYIPTNLISITDGQIYTNPLLMQQGQFPPVDIGKSVSRVGGKTQLPAYRAVAGDLRLSYAQFEELESFARFGTRLDKNTRTALERGRRVREILKQPQFAPMPVVEQIGILVAVTDGIFDPVPIEKTNVVVKSIKKLMQRDVPDITKNIIAGKKLKEEDQGMIRQKVKFMIQNEIEGVIYAKTG